MSRDFIRSRGKRLRSSSDESSNSFVRSVTSRVAGLLPDVVAKWFGSSKSADANGSVVIADVTDSSTEDETSDSPVIVQPPAKRMRHYSHSETEANINHLNTDTNCIPSNDTLVLNTQDSTVQSLPSQMTFQKETNYMSTPMTSSNLPPATVTTTGPDKSEASTSNHQHTISPAGPSVASKRKSIFGSCSTSYPKTNEATRYQQSKHYLGSPFYAGSTMYGGASASYLHQSNLTARKKVVVNELKNNDNILSQTTKRVMDLLENYSSPVSEAKRIQPYIEPPRRDGCSYDSTSTRPMQQPSYKTQELYVPTMASILSIRKRSRLMDTTNAARQLIASRSSTSDYRPSSTQTEERDPSEPKTKKSKYDGVRIPDKERIVYSELTASPYDPLHIDKHLLTTSVSSPSALKSVIVSTMRNVTQQKHCSEVDGSVSQISNRFQPYQFSSPESISNEKQQSTITSKFTFGSPEKNFEKQNVAAKKDNSSAVGAVGEVEVKGKDWQCGDCWVFNKQSVEQCICCGYKKPRKEGTAARATCSLCRAADCLLNSDRCMHCKNVLNYPGNQVNNISHTKWKCEHCWVSNEESANKCVCCGMKPSSKADELTPAGPDEWKCEQCWTINKSSVEKCAECGGAKPGATAAPPPSGTPGGFTLFTADKTFKNIVNAQTDRWECAYCLVRNDSNKSKCACCEAEKAGVTKNLPEKKFNFGKNTSFKFGIDLKLQEASLPKMTEIKTVSASKSDAEQSETNNNVLAKAPTFSFGLPAKKTEEVSLNKDKQEVDTQSPLKFSFRVPNASKTSPPQPSVFAIPAKSTDSKDDGANENKTKPQEVPCVAVSDTDSQVTRKLDDNVLAPPVNKPNHPSFVSSPSEKNKDTTNIESTSQPLATPASEKPTFSFSPGRIKISSSLFAAPVKSVVTTSSPSSAFAATSQSASVPDPPAPTATDADTSATKTAQFTKPDPDTAKVPVFQKPEDAATSAQPPSLVPAPPLFSFGTNAQTSASQPETPNFKFSFGSGAKTETPSLFTPAFGASADNVTASSKFTPAGKTLGPSNAVGNGVLPGNTTPNPMVASGTLSAVTTPGTEQSNLPNGSNIQTVTTIPGGGVFGASGQKEILWTKSSTVAPGNLFVTSAQTSMPQKPTFSFGSSTSFSSSNTLPAFGAGTPSTNVFGMGSQAATPPAMFVAPAQIPAGGMFGVPSPANNPPPSMFGTPSVGAAPSFGAPNPSVPSFEAPGLTPAPTPAAFNFGAPPPGVFGFGQVQQQSSQPSGSVYSFGVGGVPAGGTGGQHVQFNMGSVSNTPMRRMRKAVRRNTPR